MLSIWAGLPCGNEPEAQDKFEELYHTYRKLMFYVANQILHDSYQAEDAVHQSFLKAFEKIHKIGEVRCPQTKSFVVIITRNVSLNMLKSRKRKSADSLDELSEYREVPESQEFGTETLVEAADGYQRLIAAIRSLPENYAAVLLLKFVHGLNNEEIASVLELSQENVKKLIQRARKKLEGILEKEGAVL